MTDRESTKGSIDKCGYCDATPEFVLMVEDNNPIYHHTEYVCSEHMVPIQYSIIDSWTVKEWLEMD